MSHYLLHIINIHIDLKIFYTLFFIATLSQRKGNWQSEFKPWMRLFVFHFALIHLFSHLAMDK